MPSRMSRVFSDVEDPFGCSGFARSQTANDGFPFWASAPSTSSGSSTSRDSDSSETGCSPYVSIMRMTEAAIAEHDQAAALPNEKCRSRGNLMDLTSDKSCTILDSEHDGADNVEPSPADSASTSRSSTTSCSSTPLPRRSLKERILKPFPNMKLIRQPSRASKEFDLFISRIQWLCLDQSGTWNCFWSWSAFMILGAIVPAISLANVRCAESRHSQDHSFKRLVTCIDTLLCLASFAFLTSIQRTPGLRQVLQLDYVFKEDTQSVKRKYPIELHKLVKSLTLLFMPALLMKTLKNAVWFSSAEAASPFCSNKADGITNTGTVTAWFVLLEVSWAYQSLIYMFLCVLFRLMCSLQAIRIQAYIQRLEDEVDVAAMLSHHMQLRDHTATISHQFRNFLLKALVVVCASQFSALFSFLRLHGSTPISQAADLMVCAYVQLAGVLFCLHGAARITHQGHKIVTVVSQWHAAATCRNFAGARNENASSSNEPALAPGDPEIFGSIPPAMTTPPRGAAQHLAMPLLTGIHRAMHAGKCTQPASPLAPKSLRMLTTRPGETCSVAASGRAAMHGCLQVDAGGILMGSGGGEGLASGIPVEEVINGMSHPCIERHAQCAHGVEGKMHVPGQGLIKMLHRVGSGAATLVDVTEIEKEPQNYEKDAFHKRAALVTYLQHCPCGITLYGFPMDRSFLYAIFGLVFSLATFIIGRAASSHIPKESCHFPLLKLAVE